MSVYRCEDCNNPLTRDEVQSGRCPACGFRISGTDRQVDDDRSPSNYDLGYSSGRSYNSSSRDAWRVVDIALRIMLVAVIGIAVTYIIGIPLAIAAAAMRNPAMLSGILIIFIAIASIVGGIAYLVGMIMCLWAHAGRGWIIASLSLLGAGLLLTIVVALVAANSRNAIHDGQEGLLRSIIGFVIFTIIIQVMWASVLICQGMFFRSIGLHFARRALAISSTCYVAVLMVAVVLSNLSLYYSTVPLINRDQLGNVLGIMNLIATLGLCAWNAILLWHTRATIAARS